MSTRSGTSLYSAVLALNSLSTKHSTEQHRTAVHMPTMSAAVSTCIQLSLVLTSCAQMLQAAFKPHQPISKSTKKHAASQKEHPSRFQHSAKRSAKRHQHAALTTTAVVAPAGGYWQLQCMHVLLSASTLDSLAEGHDVEASLTQCRAHWGRWLGCSCVDQQPYTGHCFALSC